MTNEHDVVMAKKHLSKMVPQGTKGVVVMIYKKPHLAFEVEFIDSNNNFIELLTVDSNDIVKL